MLLSELANDTSLPFQETTFLFIPNNAVGAIIGTKGTHIRNIIRFSGASVKIAALDQEKGSEQPIERKVTIIGTAESQWKVSFIFLFFAFASQWGKKSNSNAFVVLFQAQYLIFEKMREEGFVGSGTDDVRLTVEILVPSSQVSPPEKNLTIERAVELIKNWTLIISR